MNPGLSYREAAGVGANPVRLVILLYEQAIEDLRRAIAAQARRDVEGRTREINHAILVIGHLQATLDAERGGKVSQNLALFYEQVRQGLVEAQCRQSTAEIEQQISHLMLVREAWREVERATTSPQAQSAREESTEWKA